MNIEQGGPDQRKVPLPLMISAPPLTDVLQIAGAVMTTRYGRPVAANFGSAAGELAVCVNGVGVCDRSELSVLALEGRAEQLRDCS